jgi:hypothetical protein
MFSLFDFSPELCSCIALTITGRENYEFLYSLNRELHGLFPKHNRICFTRSEYALGTMTIFHPFVCGRWLI